MFTFSNNLNNVNLEIWKSSNHFYECTFVCMVWGFSVVHNLCVGFEISCRACKTQNNISNFYQDINKNPE